MKYAIKALVFFLLIGFMQSCMNPVLEGTVPVDQEPEAADTISVTDIFMNKHTLSLTVGGDETLTFTVGPEDASVKTASWVSNHPEIATVNEEGKVVAVAAGSATITVTSTDGNKTDTCEVTVTAPVAGPPSSPSIPADTKVVEKAGYSVSGYSAFATDGSERSYFGPDSKKTLSEKTKYYRFWFTKDGKDYIIATDGSMVECSETVGHYLNAEWDSTLGWVVKKEGSGGYSVTL